MRGNITGESGSLFALSGTVANNATWDEYIYFLEAAAPSDISDLDWKMTFRCDGRNTSADFTLSTDAGTLVITQDDNGNDNVLQILVPAGQLTNFTGDYIADLASQDADGKVVLWAHGVVTFAPNPISF